MAKKYVYYFGDGKAEGTSNMKELLGGKGAGLAEMTNLGISVPPGFTISTEACVEYYKQGKKFPPGMWEASLQALKRVERSMGMGFGDPERPLTGVGAFRRPRLDARHDGYGAECRIDHEDGGRAGGQNP